jgi:hypothetical protein
VTKPNILLRAVCPALVGVAALVVLPSESAAFCRATTCDPKRQVCERDEKTWCLLTGLPLAWSSSCVSVGVHQLGSPRNGLSYDTVVGVVEQAFAAWTQAECAGGRPAITVQTTQPISCGASEYNAERGNANVVLFREDEWPYVGGDAIGLTTSRFKPSTGQLWDADIEINATNGPISTGDPIQGADLLSVLTHEAGHFLGLSHSREPGATMQEFYNPEVDGGTFRSLEADDINGICAIYPPGRVAASTSCDNRHGFSPLCGDEQPAPEEGGCSLNARTPGGRGNPGLPTFAVVLSLGLCLRLLAKRARRVRAVRREDAW